MHSSRGHPRPRREIDMSMAQVAIRIGESLPWPDGMSAAIIKQLVAHTRHKLQTHPDGDDTRFSRAMTEFPIAIHTAEANAQHYELPARFFELVLGPQRKYSCCLYED